MADPSIPVVRTFAVSLDHSIGFLVERGINNAHKLFTTAYQLSEPGTSDVIARALQHLLDVDMPTVEHIKLTARKVEGQIKYFSNSHKALLQFVDFGYTGYEIMAITNLRQQDPLSIGTLSSYPGRCRKGIKEKKSRKSGDAAAKLEDALNAIP